MSVELLNCDCLEYMRGCADNSFDLAIVDPPYRDENQPIKEMRINGSMKTLRGRPDSFYFSELCRVSKNQIIWGANNFQLPQFKGFVVWNKDITGVEGKYSQCEIASISENLGSVSKIFKFSAQKPQGEKIHPTQKPKVLYDWLLTNYAEKDQRILDTHLGSGSSAIAAHYFGCDFVGMEIDKDYYDAACKRFDNETRQLGMF